VITWSVRQEGYCAQSRQKEAIVDRTDIEPPQPRYVIGCRAGTLRPQNGSPSSA